MDTQQETPKPNEGEPTEAATVDATTPATEPPEGAAEVTPDSEETAESAAEARLGIEVEEVEDFGQALADFESGAKAIKEGSVVLGKVLKVLEKEVIVDIGYKSEGVIPIAEFGENADKNMVDEIEVLLDEIEDQTGMIRLTKRKADRIRAWNEILKTHKEGDIVKGIVQRKIKGGLLVDVGVPVFLPASQVSLRRTADISEFIGTEIEARIIKIDEQRMNIVVSRRKLVEEQREAAKKKLLDEIQEGEIRHGVVKNLTDYGAFVDLGGIDGLLHITDMAWKRVKHPSEVVEVGQEIDVKILKFDREKMRVPRGLNRLGEDRWHATVGK